MSAAVIETERFTKTFRTRFRRREVEAVRDLSLRVERGSVVAFVGPNGAGKTTTIFALLGLLRPTSGAVRIFGETAGAKQVLRRIGFQSEIFHTYGFKTAESLLRFYGELGEMDSARLAEAVPRQLERLGLAAAGRRKAGTFSKGMVQRLGLAQALLHSPELLVLDEPTTGLDPEGRKLVADIILEEKARGTTVFLSSHILSDVERTCDHVIMLREGRVVVSESMANLRGASDQWEIEVLRGAPLAAREILGSLGAPADGASASVRCRTGEKRELLLRLLQSGAEIGEVRARGRSLEELYLQHVGGTSSG